MSSDVVEPPASASPPPATEPAFLAYTSWKYRRWYLCIVTLFMEWAVAYALIKGLEGRVAETVVMISIGGLSACVFTYVFGAVWDDKNQMSLISTDTSAVKPRPGFLKLTSWKYRRAYLIQVSLFFAGVVWYSLVYNLKTNVADTAVFTSIGSLVSCVFAYVFGAVWDDRNQMSALKKP